MWVIKNRQIFFIISGVLVALALIAVFTRGLNVGIDFTGGTIMEVEYVQEDNTPELSIGSVPPEAATSTDGELGVTTPADVASTTLVEVAESASMPVTPEDVPTSQDIRAALAAIGIVDVTVQHTGESGVIIRSESLSEDLRREAIAALTFGGAFGVIEKRTSSIGPTIGAELRERAWIAIATVVIAIILFIAYVFREVSEPVSSWKYGLIAIVALVHDIIIPTGIAAIFQLNVDSLFVIALLAILGLSVNDTIVVFDRVRENLRNKISKHFDNTVGVSLEQTFVRSLNTSLTTLFVVLMLVLLGPASTRDFAIVLAVGLAVGTYSSIFLASPLLVEVEKHSKAKEHSHAHSKKKKKKK